MKDILKRILEACILCIFIIVVLFLLGPVFVPKWLNNSDNMMAYIVRGYYAEEKNSLDVLYVGNSDLYRGLSPIKIWDDYGITSYAFSSSGQRGWTTYYMLMEALKYQKPKVVFVNVDGFISSSHSSSANYRKAFDNMKLSLNKIKALNDEVYEFDIKDKISYIFPIIRYHSRAFDLTKEDFTYAYGNLNFAYKGLDMVANVKPYSNGFDYMEDNGEEFIIPENAKEYLDKIVDECKSRNIELVLMQIPSADSWSYAKSTAFNQYALDKSLDFIDFNLLGNEIDLDWESDTCDGGDHLNVYGAEKVSSYLGKYLYDNYEFEDKRNNDKYASWNLDSKKYHEDKESKILNEQDNN